MLSFNGLKASIVHAIDYGKPQSFGKNILFVNILQCLKVIQAGLTFPSTKKLKDWS